MTDTAVRRLGKALEKGLHELYVDHTADANAILAADPQLAEAIELGLAWQAVEKALPKLPPFISPPGRWSMSVEIDGSAGDWTAEAYQPVDDDWKSVSGHGATPTAALLALKDKLGSPTDD